MVIIRDDSQLGAHMVARLAQARPRGCFGPSFFAGDGGAGGTESGGFPGCEDGETARQMRQVAPTPGGANPRVALSWRMSSM